MIDNLLIWSLSHFWSIWRDSRSLLWSWLSQESPILNHRLCVSKLNNMSDKTRVLCWYRRLNYRWISEASSYIRSYSSPHEPHISSIAERSARVTTLFCPISSRRSPAPFWSQETSAIRRVQRLSRALRKPFWGNRRGWNKRKRHSCVCATWLESTINFINMADSSTVIWYYTIVA